MKKTVALFLSVMTILFAFSSCSEKEANVPQGFSAAQCDGTDYVLCYPTEWVLERCDAGMTSVYVSDNDYSSVSVTTFTWSSEYSSIAEYVEKYYFKQFSDNFNNLHYNTNEDGSVRWKKLTVGGNEALQFDYDAVFGGEKFNFRSVVIVRDGYIYTLTYTAKESLFESHTDAVDVMINNFQFKN